MVGIAIYEICQSRDNGIRNKTIKGGILMSKIISIEDHKLQIDNQYDEVKSRSGNRAVILQFPKQSKESNEIRNSISRILGNELRHQIKQQ